MVSVGPRPTLLLWIILLYELSVFIVMLRLNVFVFYVLFNIVLLLSYSVSWPPSWNKYLLYITSVSSVIRTTLSNSDTKKLIVTYAMGPR